MPSTTYRRFRKKEQIETRIPTHKLICFQINKEQYAIPIFQVQYVLKDFTTQGTLMNGHSLVRHNDENIVLIDISRLFLYENKSRDGVALSVADRNYLIVCNTKTNELIGLPTADIPRVLEIAEDCFDKLPSIYQNQVGSKGVQKLINIVNNGTLFYLNIDHLYEIAIKNTI
jgi:chemotaxis signal transduction protein